MQAIRCKRYQFLIFIISLALIAGIFNISCFAINYNNPAIPTIGDNSSSTLNNIFTWNDSFFNPSGVEEYSRGGTSDKGVKLSISNQHYYFSQYLNNIVAGKTYIIQFDAWQYLDRMKCNFSITDPAFENYVTSDVINDIGNDPDNTLSYGHYTYSFTLDSAQYSDYVVGNQLRGPIIFLDFSFKSSSPTASGYVVLKNWDIVCLDDVVVRALQSIQNTSDITQSEVQSIVDILTDDLIPMLDSWRYNSSQNQLNISQRIATLYSLLKDEFYDFEQEYGDNFTKLLYDAIVEAFGIGQDPVEFETETALSNAVNDYSDAEAAVMPSGDQAGSQIDAALSDAGADNVLSGNGAYGFIRDTINSILFENPKLTAFIVFALGMGIVVLVLGRRIHV